MTDIPKVCVCLPSGDMVHKGFAVSLALVLQSTGQIPLGDGTHLPVVPTGIADVRGSLIARNRNQCIDEATKAGFDYVLFLDSDMMFPPQTLRRLLSHEKDIVGATYVQRDPPHALMGVFNPGMALTGDRLHEVVALPGGCLLIKLSVFDTMTKPYFRTPAYEAHGTIPEHIQGEDFYFCEQASKAGHSIWLDVGLSVQLGHIGTHIARIQTEPAEADHGKISLH